MFLGESTHSIDAKNRLAIPSDIRTLSHDSGDSSKQQTAYWYVTLGEGQALCLYTDRGFEQRASELDHSDLDPDQLLAYERILFSLAKRVEMDKQGRVRLPENLLKMTGLSSEVVLIGVKDHLEIRDRQTWYTHLKQVLSVQPQILMNPRRAMKQTAPPPVP